MNSQQQQIEADRRQILTNILIYIHKVDYISEDTRFNPSNIYRLESGRILSLIEIWLKENPQIRSDTISMFQRNWQGKETLRKDLTIESKYAEFVTTNLYHVYNHNNNVFDFFNTIDLPYTKEVNSLYCLMKLEEKL